MSRKSSLISVAALVYARTYSRKYGVVAEYMVDQAAEERDVAAGA